MATAVSPSRPCPGSTTTTTIPVGPVRIQDVQDGTVATGQSVTLSDVFVTGLTVAGNGSRTFFLQEPDGVTTAGHVYPEYAGVRAFATSATASALPDLGSLMVGDCVTLSADVTEFQGATVLSEITAFDVADGPSSCGGSFPTPFVISDSGTSLFDIASDTDVATAGDQPGPKAEIFEGVLVQIAQVEVTSVEPSGDFRVARIVDPTATLLVTRLLFAFPPPVLEQTYSIITGLLTQGQVSPGVNNYRLAPRDGSDIVP
ncbi:MAG TPA: hypothetical protein VEL28_05620 [Candidatus Binatia bacterium]|nr:hypothetical protein [Candidatus Binatia bacterium]